MPRGHQRSTVEGTTIDEMDRTVGRLTRELDCLIDLGVLRDEEREALSGALGDLTVLLVRIWRAERLGAGDIRCADVRRTELCRMLRILNRNIELAYGRLCAKQ